MKKALFTGILIFLSIAEINAYGKYVPIVYQPYAGFTYLPQYSKTGFLNTGITAGHSNTMFFMNLENSIFYSSKKQEWPGIGEFRFTKFHNYSALGMGIRFLKKHRLSLCITFKLYTYKFKGKLQTENEKIRELINSDYNYQGSGAAINAFATFRLNHKFSVYVNCSNFRYNTETKGQIISSGLTFDIYEKDYKL